MVYVSALTKNETKVYNENIFFWELTFAFLGGFSIMKIVESDQIATGKRIKSGNILIIGTKPKEIIEQAG